MGRQHSGALTKVWGNLADALAATAGTSAAVLKVADRATKSGFRVALTGFPNGEVKTGRLTDWPCWTFDDGAPVGEPYDHHAQNDDHPHYRLISKPMIDLGLKARFAIKVIDDGEHFVLLTIHSPSTTAQKNGADIRKLLVDFLPQLRAALDEREVRQQAWLDGLAAGLTDPAWLVTRLDGSIVRSSAMAQRLIDAKVGLALGAGNELRIQHPKASAALTTAIAELACGAKSGGVCGPRHVPFQLETGDRKWLAVLRLVQRPTDDVERAFRDTSDHILILLRTRSMVVAPTAAALRTVFDLTKTEAATLEAVTNGIAIDDQAIDRNVGTEAVRFHIKRLYSKMDAETHAQLALQAIALLGFEFAADSIPEPPESGLEQT